MALYRKKLEIVEAIQWDETEETFKAIQAMAPKRVFWRKDTKFSLVLHYTDEKDYTDCGGWVVKCGSGAVVLYNNSAFNYLYEPHEY